MSVVRDGIDLVTSSIALRLVRPPLADSPLSGPGSPVVLDDAQQSAVARATDGGRGALLVLGAWAEK